MTSPRGIARVGLRLRHWLAKGAKNDCGRGEPDRIDVLRSFNRRTNNERAFDQQRIGQAPKHSRRSLRPARSGSPATTERNHSRDQPLRR